jgi:serine/threonine protein kinase
MKVNKINPADLIVRKGSRALNGAHTHLRIGQWLNPTNGVRHNVAIKHASLDRALREHLSEYAVKRLQEEAKLLTYLSSHNYILKCFGVCEQELESENIYQLVCEECTGGTLANNISQSTFHQRLLWLEYIAKAMRHVHDSNVVHRDLKPSNILLSNNMCGVRLADFDNSVILNESHLGEPAKPTGTLVYMAPELFLGDSGGKPSDVYSFGILAHEVLHNQAPYEGLLGPGLPNRLTSSQLINEIVHRDLRPISETASSIRESLIEDSCARQLENLIKRCWNSDSMKRPVFKDIVDEISELNSEYLLNRSKEKLLNMSNISISSHCDIGKRRHMEDYVNVIRFKTNDNTNTIAIGAVFDGHSGNNVAKYCYEKLYEIFSSYHNPPLDSPIQMNSSTEQIDTDLMRNHDNNFKNMTSCMNQSVEILQYLDQSVQLSINDLALKCGTTATIVMVDNHSIDVAWVGDSLAILYQAKNDHTNHQKPNNSDRSWNIDSITWSELNNKHSLDSPEEAERVLGYNGILKRHMKMQDDGNEYPFGPVRVYNSDDSGGLAVARSVGDLNLRPLLTGKPSASHFLRSNNDLFVVLASDGVWDVMSPQQVGEIVLVAFANRSSNAVADEASQNIVKQSIESGSQDNVSCIVIDLRSV